PSAFAASLARASCPAVSGLSSSRSPRSPGLRTEFYRRFRRLGPPVQDELALRTAHSGAVVQHELAARRALERRAAQQREQLLLERPVQGGHRHQSSRKTPTTLPRICTCGAKIGSSAAFSGWRRTRLPSR